MASSLQLDVIRGDVLIELRIELASIRDKGKKGAAAFSIEHTSEDACSLL